MKRPTNTNFSCLPSTEIRFSIDNLGCAKNQVDAEVMIASLEAHGHHYTDDLKSADLILVNTCGFIRSAREESIDAVMALRKTYSGKAIILTGCMAQRYGKALLDSMPEIDAVFGNRNPAAIADFLGNPDTVPESAFPEYSDQAPVRGRFLSFKGSVFLKIAEGCDNNCTYCAIPLIRGYMRSRDTSAILAEAEAYARQGIREINLIAQDLASWGKERGETLCGLIEKLLALPGEFRLRLLYLHPDHFPMELLALCRDNPRLLPYFDIPFQHASRRILRKMGRKGDAEAYLTMVRRIREALPGAVLRSTFLLGFPGEKDADFRILRDFITDAEVDWAGFFTYSREEGTPAWKMRGALGHRLSRPRAARRQRSLETLQGEISRRRMQRFAGRELDVLIEERVEGEDLYLGRAYPHAPDVDGVVVVHADDLKPGDMVACRIVRCNGIDLEGFPL